MSKPVQATLDILLYLECPHCDEYFDLFEYEDGRLNEEGGLIMSACPIGVWVDEHKKFEKKINCPECEKEIDIKGIDW